MLQGQQQMEWLQKNSQRDELDHLNRRVESMVRRSHAREVYKAAAETRRETIHFAVLRHSSRSSFPISSSTSPLSLRQKLRERALGPGDRWLDDILTADDTWDYIADRLVPRVFRPRLVELADFDFKNTMLGAVQLQQTRVGKNERCAVPTIYEREIRACYPMLAEAQTSDDRYGRESQFEAAMVGIELLGIGPLAPTPKFLFEVPSDANASAAAAAVRQLQASRWIDLQTRQVKISPSPARARAPDARSMRPSPPRPSTPHRSTPAHLTPTSDRDLCHLLQPRCRHVLLHAPHARLPRLWRHRSVLRRGRTRAEGAIYSQQSPTQHTLPRQARILPRLRPAAPSSDVDSEHVLLPRLLSAVLAPRARDRLHAAHSPETLS